jgi:hypothetical protein
VLTRTDPRYYRLTVDDFDPSWAEWHADRLADVHGARASDGHYWTLNGRWVDGYEPGAVCGGCGWRPDAATSPDD